MKMNVLPVVGSVIRERIFSKEQTKGCSLTNKLKSAYLIFRIKIK